MIEYTFSGIVPSPLPPEFFMTQLILWASDDEDLLSYYQPTAALVRHRKVLQEMFNLIDQVDYDKLQLILSHEMSIENGWSLGDLLIVESITGFNIQPADVNTTFPSSENEHLWNAGMEDDGDEEYEE